MDQLINLPDNETALDTTDALTKDMLAGVIPDKRFRKHISDELIDLVNAEPESEIRRVYRDNILSYSSVLATGKYSLTAYVHAVKFVSLKLLGDKHSIAYSKVFPDRYQELINKGATPSKIASFADNYSKNALVVKILEQTMVPTHILNAGIYQQAINTQADLMLNANSEMVRQKAAESLMNNLAAPVAAKLELDMTQNASDALADLRETTAKLAQQQLRMIAGGQFTAKDAAHSDIIAKKVKPVETTYYDIPEEK